MTRTRSAAGPAATTAAVAPSTTTMRAIVQEAYGDAEVLRSADVRSPAPSATTRCWSGCTRRVSTAARGT